MEGKCRSMTLAARALSHVTESRDDARARILRDNAELFAWRAPFLTMGTSSYMRCEITGREWGKPFPGRAVTASASQKLGKQRKGWG